jgi:protein-disulfide isomerase/uncharacterized membrane protein
MLYRRAAIVTAALASIGLIISGVIVSIHRNLTASPTYASFCNVNETVVCDLVLTSDYAYLFGVPVAWWALLTYAIWVAIALLAITTQRATRRRQLATVQFVLATWSLLYSIFLAIVSFAILRALCVLCGSLYLVNAALFVTAWVLLGAARTEGKVGTRAKEWWQRQTRLVATGAGLAVLVFIALALWEAFGRDQRALSAEDLARQFPDFHAWYTSLPVAAVDAGGRHRIGGSGGVVIVEFSDFECPHCARAHRDLKRVLPRFGSDVQVVFRHFPLSKSCNPAVTGSAHRYACLAASASECAAQQDRFWEYQDLLFENQSALDRDNLVKYAERIGLDRARFLTCLDSDAPRDAVRDDVAAAEKLGVSSTPTFFLNGRVLRGALDSDKLEYAIRLERAAQRTGS